MLYTGVTGKISVDFDGTGVGTAKDIAHMANWSVELSKDMIEAVSFGEDYKEKVPSVKDWSASFDGSADFATTSGQKELLDAFEAGTLLDASFYLDADTFFKGNAYIESLSFESAADGKVDTSISLAGSGGVLLTLPT